MDADSNNRIKLSQPAFQAKSLPAKALPALGQRCSLEHHHNREFGVLFTRPGRLPSLPVTSLVAAPHPGVWGTPRGKGVWGALGRTLAADHPFPHIASHPLWLSPHQADPLMGSVFHSTNLQGANVCGGRGRGQGWAGGPLGVSSLPLASSRFSLMLNKEASCHTCGC